MDAISEYQQTGSIPGYGKKELAAANEALSAAKRATPAEMREQFRGGVRFDKHGYYWFWVLRN